MPLRLLFSLAVWWSLQRDPLSSEPISEELLLFLYAWQICKLLSKLIAECAEGIYLTRSWGLASVLKSDQYEKLLSLYNATGSSLNYICTSQELSKLMQMPRAFREGSPLCFVDLQSHIYWPRKGGKRTPCMLGSVLAYSSLTSRIFRLVRDFWLHSFHPKYNFFFTFILTYFHTNNPKKV